MKPTVLDKLTKTGRLRARLEEIAEQVNDRRLARMEGGDHIGRQIVASLTSLTTRSGDESRLLFEAQRLRAQMYNESSGATALEAAEALADARTVLSEYDSTPEELASLAPTAWAILQDLRRIGSRRNSWNTFRVLFDAVDASDENKDLRSALIDLFQEMVETMIKEKSEVPILQVLTRVADFAKRVVPERFNDVVNLIPKVVTLGIDRYAVQEILEAFLFARHLCVAFDGKTLRRIIMRFAEARLVSTEVRAIYHDFLLAETRQRARMEPTFEHLANVDPDPKSAYDDDLDALNEMLSEFYGEGVWVWRNRALLYRRRNDPVAAIACLARAMNITGNPPEVMGLLAPSVLAMGFDEAARVFANFVPEDFRERFHLGILDDLAEEPGSEEARRDLLGRLETALALDTLPSEFRRPLHKKCAGLLFDLGLFKQSADRYETLFHEEPSDELCAVRLAETMYRLGDLQRTRSLAGGNYSSRTLPLVEHLRSRLDEDADDRIAAIEHNQKALDALADAQEAGRELKQKSIVALATRIVRMFGKEHVNSALLSVLESEVFGTRHSDLEILHPILERRAVDLAMRIGDVERARTTVVELAARHPNDREVLIHGVRACLRSGHIGEADEFLQRTGLANDEDNAELDLLRGLLASAKEEYDVAVTHFESAMSRVPTAEARLALAALRLRNNDESGAFELLGSWSDEEGGVAETRRKIHDLRGRLLERRGDRTGALAAYLEAAASGDGWNDSRRRAGLLSIEQALDERGRPIDRDLLQRGIQLLEGFNDGDSVTHHALARAAIEPSEIGCAFLGTSLKRVSGDNWTRLFVARIKLLLDLGRFDEARMEIEQHLAEPGIADKARVELTRVAAELERRKACALLEDIHSIDDGRLKAVRRAFDTAQERANTPWFAQIGNWIGALTSESDTAPVGEPPADAPAGLRVAWALLASGRLPSAADWVREVAEHGGDSPEETLLATLLRSLTPEHAAPEVLLRVIGELEAAKVPLPFSKNEMLHAAAVKALLCNEQDTLDDLLAAHPLCLHDLKCFAQLEAIARAENADAASVLGILLDLDQLTEGKGLGDRLLDEKLARVRARVTEMRETPSPAWACSRLRTAGKRTRLYSPEVIAFWEKRASEADATAWHPIALMRLAVAHEQEVLGTGASAAWKSAHDAWRHLLGDDEFWKRSATRLEKIAPNDAAAAVAAVRHDIPRWILQAHLNHAKGRIFANDLARGIEHGRLVAQSPLLDLVDHRMRDEIFTSLAGQLERHLSHRRYEEALASIDHVIVADPTNPIARREMARVAAAALQQNLGMVDILVRPPDAQTIAEISTIMGRILAIADRPVIEFAHAGVTDPQTARCVATCLRAKAWVSYHRDHAIAEAGEALDLAIQVMKSVGLEFQALAKFRSEIGLKVVEETMKKSPTGQIARPKESDPVDRAMAEVDQLLSLDPDNIKVITQKVRLLLVKDRDAEAESVARDLFKKAQQRAEPSTVRAAVELLHMVQAGREKMRYDGKMSLVDELIAQRNWRAALALFKEAVVGRENEPKHLRKQIEILLGLHKLDPLDELIDQLEDFEGQAIECKYLRARLACLRSISLVGGDLLAAWELHERGEHSQAITISNDLLAADAAHAAARFILASCQKATGQDGLAKQNGDRAIKDRAAKDRAGQNLDWIVVLLEHGVTKS